MTSRALLEGSRIVADDPVREPRRRSRHGEVVDLFLTGRHDAHDAIPEQITRGGRRAATAYRHSCSPSDRSGGTRDGAPEAPADECAHRCQEPALVGPPTHNHEKRADTCPPRGGDPARRSPKSQQQGRYVAGQRRAVRSVRDRVTSLCCFRRGRNRPSVAHRWWRRRAICSATAGTRVSGIRF